MCPRQRWEGLGFRDSLELHVRLRESQSGHFQKLVRKSFRNARLGTVHDGQAVTPGGGPRRAEDAQ